MPDYFRPVFAGDLLTLFVYWELMALTSAALTFGGLGCTDDSDAPLRTEDAAVTEGFSKTLEINGVGYRAQAQGNKLTLNLGYSHDVIFDVPEGVSAPDAIELENGAIRYVAYGGHEAIRGIDYLVRDASWRTPPGPTWSASGSRPSSAAR